MPASQEISTRQRKAAAAAELKIKYPGLDIRILGFNDQNLDIKKLVDQSSWDLKDDETISTSRLNDGSTVVYAVKKNKS